MVSTHSHPKAADRSQLIYLKHRKVVERGYILQHIKK